MHGYTQVVDTATENEIENDSCDSLGSSSQPPTDFTSPSGTEFDDIEPYVSEVAPIPLFDGSTLTVVQTLVKYFHWFCQHPGISKKALSSMLSLQRDILPKGHLLPTSYENALLEILPMRMPY